MSYPEIPPVELLNQLAPDVREYCLNKVNDYYRYKREVEDGRKILDYLNGGSPLYFTNPQGKPCVIRGAKPEDIETIGKLTKEY